MSKSGSNKTQFNVRLPNELVVYIDDRYRGTGVERPLQALAGLAAYECLGVGKQKAIMQWATRILQGEITWGEFVNGIKSRETKQDLSQERLVRTLEEIIRRHMEDAG